MLFIQGSGMIVRAKYYGAWKFAEASCSLTKISFNGYDNEKKPKFDRAENVNVLGVEFGENPKMLTDNWNKYFIILNLFRYTNVWLKRTVYTRTSKNYRMPLTYFTSAFWHGFFPGYYLTFVSASLATLTGRTMRKHLHPIFNSSQSNLSFLKPVYDIVGSVCSITLMNYFFIPFMLREFNASVNIWMQTFFFAHVVTTCVIFVMDYGGIGKKLSGAFVPHITKKDK
jgi:lysophospholipid acyltransferase